MRRLPTFGTHENRPLFGRRRAYPHTSTARGRELYGAAADVEVRFERDGARLVIDDLSLDFVKGSTVTYTYGEMIGETFEVQDNPMSEGSCGCGVSFAPSGG